MWRRVELFCGLGCGVLGLLPFFWRHGMHVFALFNQWPELLLDAVLLYFLPGLLVAAGSYLHAVRRKTAGFLLVLVVGILLTLMMFVHLVGGVFYLYGIGGGLIILGQGLLALITVVASLFGGSSSNNNGRHPGFQQVN